MTTPPFPQEGKPDRSGGTPWTAWARWVHDQAAKVAAKLSVTDLSATGTPSDTTFLRGDNTWAQPPAGAGTGVSDHGSLTGLGDDDHTQYLNNTRGDARYVQLGNLVENVQDIVAGFLKAGAGLTAVYDDDAGTFTITPTANATVTPTTVSVTATPGAGSITVAWQLAVGTDGANGAIVSRDGTDTSNSGVYFAPNALGTSGSITFDKLLNTAYTITVQPTHDGVPVGSAGTAQATPTGEAAAAARAVPLVAADPNKSQLPWNSLVFGHGADPTPFGVWRGRPVDGVVYFPARKSWADMRQFPSRRPGDLMVYSIPPFPEGLGLTNASVANGSQDANIRAWAAAAVTAGWNHDRTVIRLAWEPNGTWYEWRWNNGTLQNAFDAWRRFVTQARAAGLTNVRWAWCLNKGPQGYNGGYSWQSAYPGNDVVDVIGIDWYDHAGPITNETTYQAETLGGGTYGKNPGAQQIADFARANGKMISVDEWGTSHATQAVDGFVGGGDNPYYVQRMLGFCKANADILAFEGYFDHVGNPSTLRHKISDGAAGSNPNAGAEYRKAYPNGWG